MEHLCQGSGGLYDASRSWRDGPVKPVQVSTKGLQRPVLLGASWGGILFPSAYYTHLKLLRTNTQVEMLGTVEKLAGREEEPGGNTEAGKRPIQPEQPEMEEAAVRMSLHMVRAAFGGP